MKRLPNLKVARAQVLADMNAFLASVRELTQDDVQNSEAGLALLRNVRRTVYEELNQIQHEYLVLEGAEYLSNSNFAPEQTEWYWNPRQTGDSTEPDLRGIVDGEIVISAEATTSEKAQGVIDSRMRDTLVKLNGMPGARYYFVRTAQMETRANTKCVNNGHDVHVVRLGG